MCCHIGSKNQAILHKKCSLQLLREQNQRAYSIKPKPCHIKQVLYYAYLQLLNSIESDRRKKRKEERVRVNTATMHAFLLMHMSVPSLSACIP